jgi:hypothetical protein
MAASMKIAAFWDMAPCSLVEAGRRFGGAYVLHHKGDGLPRYYCQYCEQYTVSACKDFGFV